MHIKLSKNGQISIPKKLQQQLEINEGDSLYIYQNNYCILIQKHHPNPTLNQCVFSYGKITIPIELRRILDISPMTPLSMEVSIDRGVIFIYKVKEVMRQGVNSALIPAD